jgi:hypothetical protein
MAAKTALVGGGIRLLRRIARKQELTFHLGTWGRLGNQLFQIAGTYAIACRVGVGVIFRDDWPYRDYFSLSSDLYARRLTMLRCNESWPLAIEIDEAWRVYLQDLGLWDGRRDEIHALLQPSERAVNAAVTRHPDFVDIPNKTAIHVRRGDYLAGALHQPCPMSYYEQAIDQIRTEDATTQFVVFSDDIEWGRRQLPVADALYISGNPDWLDLTLMARCKHHICANSTFSWWGAFLSDNPSPIVPWLTGVLPETFRRIHPAEWREIEITPDIDAGTAIERQIP